MTCGKVYKYILSKAAIIIFLDFFFFFFFFFFLKFRQSLGVKQSHPTVKCTIENIFLYI